VRGLVESGVEGHEETQGSGAQGLAVWMRREPHHKHNKPLGHEP